MRKSKKLLVGFLSLLTIAATISAFGFVSAANSNKGNLVAGGDAENGNLSSLEAVETEYYEGTHSFKVTSDIQIRIASPKVDGTKYVGSAMVKADQADSTFYIVATATSKDTSDNWNYSYLDLWENKTIGTEWVEYSFSFWYNFDSENNQLSYYRGSGEVMNVANIKSPLEGFDLIFRTSGGQVYMDNLNIVEVNKSVEGDLTPFGDAEEVFSDYASRTLTPCKEEAYNGFSSYKLNAGDNQYRVTLPKADGTKYNGSMMVKGDGTLYLIGMTISSSGSAWPQTYLDLWENKTVSGEWLEYAFNFSILYNADDKTLTVNRGVGENVVSNDIDSFAAFELVFRTTGTVYIDNLHIIPEAPSDPTEAYDNAIKYFSFEEDMQGFGEAYPGAGPSSQTTEEGETHNSTGALKVKDLWTRNTLMDLGLFADGQIYTLYMYTKQVINTPSVNAYIYLWADNDERIQETYVDAYEQVENAIKVVELQGSQEWTRVSGTFGAYILDGKAYGYCNGNLNVIDDSIGAGKVIAKQWAIDLGNYGGTVCYDDIALFPTTIKGNAKVTVTGVDDAEVKVYKNGTLLATQPEVEKQGNDYTVKGLKYSTLSEVYTLSIEKASNVIATRDVTYIKNEVSVSAVKYDASITVKDDKGQAITNASLLFGETEITENTAGVYAITELDSNLVVTIKAEGKISKKITITSDNATQEVVLKDKKPETVVEGNIVEQGTIEDGFTYTLNPQGVSLEVTDEEQCDGEKSLRLTTGKDSGRTLYRIPSLEQNGTLYSLSAMVKGDGCNFAMGMMLTCSAVAGGYAYIPLTGVEVATTDTWTKYNMLFSINYDEVSRKISYTVNGQTTQDNTEISNIPGFDVMFIMNAKDKEVFVDNIVLLTCYDAKVKVADETGNFVSNATFEVEDYTGKYSVTPSFNDETKEYTLANLSGIVKIYATVGTKTYDAVTVSKSLTNVIIENSYAINLTLKDQNGNLVKGVNVIARKGITTVGTFTDNGDGTYTLTGVMGEVTIVPTLSGYEFDKTTASVSNATLTITGTKEVIDEPETSKKGCGSSIGISLLGLAALVVVGKKKLSK